jgi:hypothetical protein
VKRQPAMPLAMVWLVSVAASWVATTAVLAVLIRSTTDLTTAGLIGQAAASATFACVVVAGPGTAVALRVRRRGGPRSAVLSGLATTAVILLFLWSYVAATGTPVIGPWQGLLPLAIVTAAQLWLALRLRRQCRDAAPPGQSPPGTDPPGPDVT